jgi:hypothetical protein
MSWYDEVDKEARESIDPEPVERPDDQTDAPSWKPAAADFIELPAQIAVDRLGAQYEVIAVVAHNGSATVKYKTESVVTVEVTRNGSVIKMRIEDL